MRNRNTANTKRDRRVLFLCIGLSCAMATRPLGARFGSDDFAFEQRKDRLLVYYASRTTTPSFQAACAKLATGVDETAAWDMIRTLISRPSGEMFYIYPLIGTVLHFQDRLPSDIRHGIRDVFRIYTPYRGDTENHWLMYYTAMFLASELWPHQIGELWFNGKSSEENFEEAKSYLRHWIRTTTTIGQGEFDSPDYAGVYLSPMSLLADFARDPEIRIKARMMMDYLLADWAGEHLKGMLCGGVSRVYEPQVYTPRQSVVSTLLWLYFGDCQFNPDGSLHEAIFPALSAYRCPEIIRRIATDRSQPYVHCEIKRVRNVIRYGEEMNPPVFKTAFMTRQYCLGSLQGGILQPIQQHTWDITWVSDSPHPRIFTLHPYFSAFELASFFPEEPKILVEEVVKSKGTYNKPDKWTGGSPFEQTFQQENAIIVLYDIRKGEGWGYVDGFFPKQLDERREDPSGWIFCREKGVFVAVRPLKPYVWIDESQYTRLRSPHLRNGFVVEVSGSDEYVSFDAFQKQIRNNPLDISSLDRNGTVLYGTSHGDLMQFTYDGARRLDGEEVRLDKKMLFNGPFLKSVYGSGSLEIRHEGFVRVLDFNKPEIREAVE